jgi:hypothetical protein
VQWLTTCLSKFLLFSLRVQQGSLLLVSTKASSLRTAPETPAPRGDHLGSYGLYVSLLRNNRLTEIHEGELHRKNVSPSRRQYLLIELFRAFSLVIPFSEISTVLVDS